MGGGEKYNEHSAHVCFFKHRPGCQFISDNSTGFQSLAGFPRSVYHRTITHTLECVGDLLLCLEET